MTQDNALQTFVVESRELLQELESGLLGYDTASVDPDVLNAIFRAVHTIKGGAGLFSIEHIVAFSHRVESVLVAVRDGSLSMDAELITLLLSCCDHLSALVDAVADGHMDADEATAQVGAPLLEQLGKYVAPPPQPKAESPGFVLWDDDEAAPAATAQAAPATATPEDRWHISLRFGRDVLRHGLEPMSFIRYLGNVGTVAGIVTLAEEMPAAEQMDPESCYLGFEISLDSTADKVTISNVFALLGDDCSVRILPPKSLVSEHIHMIADLPCESARLGEILVRCGALTEAELEVALSSQKANLGPAPPLGAILVEQGIVRPTVLEAALAKQQHVREAKAQESRSMRVDAEKLDQLINLIGELIIASANSHTLARQSSLTALQESTANVVRLVEDVRDNALQLRMVKIGASFTRFQRLVHDAARDLGKDIRLVVTGEETELDKTLVEKITDPLTHLVRNAIDHGIEAPALRQSRGKPAHGTLTLNACHDSGSVVIEVSDDGGGLKRDKILAKAVARGLVPQGASLTEGEIHNLIFEPGFSTADNVTNLSGRGVGMDVVKRNVSALRGSVSIHSQEGLGTRVAVRLPLTLAIIDGFLVGVGKSSFVVPLDMVQECIGFSMNQRHDLTDLRGRALPFIRLRQVFNLPERATARESIVVVKHAGREAGLVVDTLLGEFQTVIKPLGRMLQNARCISGSSILGTGEVALILDVPALLQRAESFSARLVPDAQPKVAAI